MENEYMNEDERDEQERNRLNDSDDKTYQLTPKGLFFLMLTKYFGVMSMDDDRIDLAWDEFEQWVRTHYGHGEYVGGIAFARRGGEFVPMLAGAPPPDIDDVDE